MNLRTVAPTLFSDTILRMDAWGSEGKIDPFDDVYHLVFQMTVRMATCEELAGDPLMVQKMRQLYWKLQESATAVSLLLPWFPSAARRNKAQATKDLYNTLSHYVDIRRKAQVPSTDAIDVLIADGEDDGTIVEESIVLLFLNTQTYDRSIVCLGCCFRWCYQHGHDV
jgi:sterol 14-demethylase